MALSVPSETFPTRVRFRGWVSEAGGFLCLRMPRESGVVRGTRPPGPVSPAPQHIPQRDAGRHRRGGGGDADRVHPAVVPAAKLGAIRARMTPEGMVTHTGPTYRCHLSPAHACPNTHCGKAMASKRVGRLMAGRSGAVDPVLTGTVMMSAMPRTVMTKARKQWRVRERRAERLYAPRVTFPALTTEGKYGCP